MGYAVLRCWTVSPGPERTPGDCDWLHNRKSGHTEQLSSAWHHLYTIAVLSALRSGKSCGSEWEHLGQLTQPIRQDGDTNSNQ
jgi:hypothetical protein